MLNSKHGGNLCEGTIYKLSLFMLLRGRVCFEKSHKESHEETVTQDFENSIIMQESLKL